MCNALENKSMMGFELTTYPYSPTISTHCDTPVMKRAPDKTRLILIDKHILRNLCEVYDRGDVFSKTLTNETA